MMGMSVQRTAYKCTVLVQWGYEEMVGKEINMRTAAVEQPASAV